MSLEKNYEAIQNELIQISNQLYENPELGDQEFESMKLLVKYLKSYDFEVETGIVDRPTAFRAEYTSGKPGQLLLIWQSMMRCQELDTAADII